MSDSFIVAGKLALSRDEYDRWLASPAPGPASLTDWNAMYAGWSWDGKRPSGAWREKGTVEATLSRVLSWAATDPWIVLLRYEDGVFRFVVVCAMGPVDTAAEELVATFRSASAFKSDGVDWVLYWSEPSGLFDFSGMLSVARVAPGQSAFVATADRERLARDHADLDAWLGAYLEGAGEVDAWARAEFADPNFVARARRGG